MSPAQRLAQLAAEAAGAPTPRASLRLITELRRELDAFERRQVAHALAEGSSFAAIARDLGISRQAAHSRFRDLAAGELPIVTAPDVRRVLQYAREEAALLGAGALRAEHIVIAVLRAEDLDAAVVLRASGASLERARVQAKGAATRTKMFRHDSETGELRALLEAPARHARARGGRRMEVEDLLLGTLEEHDGATRLLQAIGVDVNALRRRLTALLASSY